MPISQNFPAVRPTLLLDFAKSKVLDPRITFTRSTTATYTNSSGLIASAAVNTPRFDHDPITGKSLGLRIEEQRTNLLTYSEDFSNAVWTKDSATITTNQIIAPDGTLTADLLVASTRMYWFDNTGIIGAKVQSIFAKQQTGTSIAISAVGGQTVVGGANVTVNLATGAITSGHVAPNVVVSPVGNGFWRIAILTSVSVASGNSTYWQILSTPGIYIWGAQLEAGAFPTSYIPTVASQITRTADTVTMTGANFSNWYRQDEGTFVAESTKVNQTTSSFPRVVQVDDGTDSNKITLLWWTQGNQLYSAVTTLGVSQADLGLNGFTQTASNAISQGYKVNDLTVSINGSAVITDTLITIPTVTTLRIGASNFGVESSMCIERFFYYPTRLSNTNLQALTV